MNNGRGTAITKAAWHKTVQKHAPASLPPAVVKRASVENTMQSRETAVVCISKRWNSDMRDFHLHSALGYCSTRSFRSAPRVEQALYVAAEGQDPVIVQNCFSVKDVLKGVNEERTAKKDQKKLIPTTPSIFVLSGYNVRGVPPPCKS